MEKSELKPRYIEGKGIFIPVINKVLAMKDSYNGKCVTWEEAVKAGAFSKEDAYIIMYFKDEINRLLKKNGGEPLDDDWYWTSTQYSAAYAWYLLTFNGNMTTTSKPNYNRVRAVSALEI